MSRQREAYRAACVNEEVRRQGPKPYDVTISVDAAGREVHREIQLARGSPPSPLDDCVKKFAAPPLAIAPPGKSATGKVLLMLP